MADGEKNRYNESVSLSCFVLFPIDSHCQDLLFSCEFEH